ncbi:MAG: transcriptional repressor [Anaerolineae bacterium]|nr:transcriptional repressor [Anaerolineae bacterium]
MSFIEQANETIRAAGGRMTTQRQLIIELIEEVNDQLDAEGLFQLARERDDSINLTTIYRTLNTLESAGLIRQQYISPDHDRKYYTLTGRTYHFTCRKCKRVIPFKSDLIDQLKHHLETELHAMAINACVCVDGLCPDCQAEEQR